MTISSAGFEQRPNSRENSEDFDSWFTGKTKSQRGNFRTGNIYEDPTDYDAWDYYSRANTQQAPQFQETLRNFYTFLIYKTV